MRKLYKVYVNYGRNGSIAGLFVMDELEYEARIEKGTLILWDEELGRHSEGEFEFSAEHVTEVTDDQDFIQKAETLEILPYGFDMVGYLEAADERELGNCEECGEEVHEDELDEHGGLCASCAENTEDEDSE